MTEAKHLPRLQLQPPSFHLQPSTFSPPRLLPPPSLLIARCAFYLVLAFTSIFLSCSSPVRSFCRAPLLCDVRSATWLFPCTSSSVSNLTILRSRHLAYTSSLEVN